MFRWYNGKQSSCDSVEFFECRCLSMNHTVRFNLNDWNDGEPEDKHCTDEVTLEIDVFLSNYKGIFGRMWGAFKYVFGLERRYGDYDGSTIQHQDVDRLLELCHKYKEIRAKYEV